MTNISQFFITDSRQELPKSFEESLNSVKLNLIHQNHHVYTKIELQELISNNFPKEVFNAFLKLKPYALKKDLASYCLGYLIGGWFIDITIKIIIPLDIKKYNNIEFIAFKDFGQGALNPRSLNYPLQVSLFYTKPRHKIMAKAIDLVIENCRNEYYGATSSCPTGPSILGRAQSFYGTNMNQMIGCFLPLTPDFEQKNKSYVLPNGEIFALHKDSWFKSAIDGDLKNFGAKGTNNHLLMYSQKEIYDKEILI